jgi:hypothetical protein
MRSMPIHKKCLMMCAVVALSLLSGCGVISNQSVYEGIRGNDKAKTTGTTQKPNAMPNDDSYEKEREVLKK